MVSAEEYCIARNAGGGWQEVVWQRSCSLSQHVLCWSFSPSPELALQGAHSSPRTMRRAEEPWR